MKKMLKIVPLMDRIVHNGDIVYSKTGYYKVLAAYGEDGTRGCKLRDSVYVFVPNEVITAQEAKMIMEKPDRLRTDLDMKQWLQWRFTNIRWDTPAHYDIARYKNEYCYDYKIDNFTEDKYLFEKSEPCKRNKKPAKNWYVESHQ